MWQPFPWRTAYVDQQPHLGAPCDEHRRQQTAIANAADHFRAVADELRLEHCEALLHEHLLVGAQAVVIAPRSLVVEAGGDQ